MSQPCYSTIPLVVVSIIIQTLVRTVFRHSTFWTPHQAYLLAFSFAASPTSLSNVSILQLNVSKLPRVNLLKLIRFFHICIYACSRINLWSDSLSFIVSTLNSFRRALSVPFNVTVVFVILSILIVTKLRAVSF